MAKKFYALLESEGYLISVPSRDIQTADVSAIQVGDQNVAFSYGSKALRGTVLHIAQKEKEVLNEMTKVKSQRRLAKSTGSFHAERPRLAKTKAMGTNMVTGQEKAKPILPADLKAKAKRDKKKEAAILKDRADLAIHSEISAGSVKDITLEVPQKVNVSSDSEESSSSSASSTSSLSDSSVRGVKQKRSKNDITQLREMKTDSEVSDDEDKIITSISERQSESDKNKVQNSDVEIDMKTDNAVCDDENAAKQAGGSGSSTGKSSVENISLPGSSIVSSKSISEDNSSAGRKSKKKGKKDKTKHEEKNPKSDRSKEGKKTVEEGIDTKEKKEKEEDAIVKKEVDGHGKLVKVLDSESSSEGSISEDEPKPKKIKRNRTVYDGLHYLHKEDDVGVVKLHESFAVYVVKNDLDLVTTNAKTPMGFIRNMVEKVYTSDAIQNCTAQGFPARSKGAKKLKTLEVQPAIHPAGRLAIIDAAKKLQKTRKDWHPRRDDSTLRNAFSQRLSELKKENKQ